MCLLRLLDEDGTETLNIDEFTGTMMRLMVDGPGESTLERAREQALTKAFNDADTDNSGSLDISEIAKLMKEANPLRTQSEIDRQVRGESRAGSKRGGYVVVVFFSVVFDAKMRRLCSRCGAFLTRVSVRERSRASRLAHQLAHYFVLPNSANDSIQGVMEV